jgi:hypothetical protein
LILAQETAEKETGYPLTYKEYLVLMDKLLFADLNREQVFNSWKRYNDLTGNENNPNEEPRFVDYFKR